MRNRSFVKQLVAPTYWKRFLFFFVADVLAIVLSLYASFLLRFEFSISDRYYNTLIQVLPFFVAVKLAAFAFFRLYSITWRYVGLSDLWNIIKSLLIAELVLIVLTVGFTPFPKFLRFLPAPDFRGFPRSVFFIDGIISLILIGSLRVSKRFFLEIVGGKRHGKGRKKTVIIGAGHTGEMILRDVTKQDSSEFYPFCFLDDDEKKAGTYIHGVRVLGTTADLPAVVSEWGVEAVIIAIPSLDFKALRRIYDTAKEAKVETVKIVPRIYEVHKPEINLKNLEEIRIEDLIGRQAVRVNYDEIERFLNGKAILVTGAGGSIGAEITLQVCGFKPERLVLFDSDETELYSLELRLRRDFPSLKNRLFFMAGDVRDEERVNEVFRECSPQVVFHSAAYKHVPMMEFNPKEAVKVNIVGSYKVAKASVESKVEKCILISTDKAIRPTSIMGATKRIAEHIGSSLNGCGSTGFVSVRFGNVLGSRGSVLPLFMEQLRNGGPLTVTHPDMRRYFMTIPEAVSLVLQASVIGQGGEVLVLDMGDPVKIVHLAEDLIRIHGLEPYKDIDIDYTGIRPGEKLFEEILSAEEGTIASRHQKIFIARNTESFSRTDIERMLEEFEAAMRISSPEGESAIRTLLRKYVRHFEDRQ